MKSFLAIIQFICFSLNVAKAKNFSPWLFGNRMCSLFVAHKNLLREWTNVYVAELSKRVTRAFFLLSYDIQWVSTNDNQVPNSEPNLDVGLSPRYLISVPLGFLQVCTAGDGPTVDAG